MDLRLLTRLLVKMTGAAIIVWAIAGISGTVVHVFQMTAQDVSLLVIVSAAILPTAIPLLIGVILLTFPGMVTNFFVRGEDIVGPPSKALWQIEGVMYSLFGVYLMVTAITDGIYHYSKFRLYHKIIENPPYLEMPRLLPQDFGAIVSTGAQLIIGIGLILGANGLAKLFRRLRGTRDEE